MFSLQNSGGENMNKGMQRLMVVMGLMIVMWGGSGMSTAFGAGANPERVAFRQAARLVPLDGDVEVTLDWLERPGEFALTIRYWGPLTQEGPVNVYLDLNGVRRTMVTLTELPNRHQMVKILSFQPTRVDADGRTALRPLAPGEIVDPELFRNAAWYPQFGANCLEFKFYVNGRWEGDPKSQAHNGNWRVTFNPPVG